MVDTVRTVPYLLASEFQDGQTGGITAQYMRDLIVSLALRSCVSVLDYLPAGQPDGTTDNTTGIQAAITAGNGQTVYFPALTNAFIHGGLTVPTNTHLVIDGTLKLKASAGNVHNISGTSVNNIVIEGNGTIDGNHANQGGVTGGSALYFGGSSAIIVRGLQIQNAQRSNINCESCSNVFVEDCILINGVFASQFSGALGTACNNCWAKNLLVSNCTDYGWAFYDGVTNSGVTACGFSGCGPVGILTDGLTLGSQNILIDGNIITNGSAAGVSVSCTLTTVRHTNVIVTNNVISTCVNGMVLSSADHVVVSNNVVYSNTGTAGIVVGQGGTNQDLTDYAITGNIVRANYNGIYFQAGSNGTVTGNSINGNVNGADGKGLLFATSNTATMVTANHLFANYIAMADNGGDIGAGTVIVGNLLHGNTAANYFFTHGLQTDNIVEAIPSGTTDVTARVVTAAGTITMVASDKTIIVNKASGAATALTLIASPATGRRINIIDGKGDANTNNITISPAAGNINGASTLVINTAYGRTSLIYNGTQWNIAG